MVVDQLFNGVHIEKLMHGYSFGLPPAALLIASNDTDSRIGSLTADWGVLVKG